MRCKGIYAAGLALGLLAGAARAEPTLPAPVTDADYAPLDMGEVELGQLLFWDPILSGNRNISCGTCHHPRFGTSDGLSLGLGEGGIGLGPDRVGDPDNLPEQRIPRNAPGLFNLGARAFTVMFHDGRIEVDAARPSGLRTPLEDEMLEGFDSLLSAQTMFPVLSPDEMAGHYAENDVSKAVRSGRITGPGGAWDILAQRVQAIPDYAARFDALGRQDPDFTDISDVIAAFVAFEWRSDDSPFDRHLRGEAKLTGAAARGMAQFYGPAGCAGCHAGAFQTDHAFHPMGAPQIGPGKSERFERHQMDEGRMRVTGRVEDRFAFRTPSLRNVALTAPYGHAGAHAELAAFLRDHTARTEDRTPYDPAQAILPQITLAKDDFAPLSQAELVLAIAEAAERAPDAPDDAAIADLVAFLAALTDPGAQDGRLGIPDTVPSGLPVDR